MLLLPAFTGAPELNRVYHCDALTLLKALPDASVGLRGEYGIIETSPRACNTGDMSQHWLGVPTVDKYTTRNCPVCGKSYLAETSRLKYGRQTTCSRECSYLLRASKQSLDASTAVTTCCAVCGTSVRKTPGKVKRAKNGLLFCSRKCYQEARRNNLIPTPNRRPVVICNVCGAKFKSTVDTAKYCSRGCFELAHSHTMKGINNPSFIDGRSSEKRSYRGPDWESIRVRVYERDGYKCQSCGVKCISRRDANRTHEYEHVIQCHHIDPFRLSKNNDLDNLVTLCLSCHLRIEQGGTL